MKFAGQYDVKSFKVYQTEDMGIDLGGVGDGGGIGGVLGGVPLLSNFDMMPTKNICRFFVTLAFSSGSSL